MAENIRTHGAGLMPGSLELKDKRTIAGKAETAYTFEFPISIFLKDAKE